jgi:hypothetical protein
MQQPNDFAVSTGVCSAHGSSEPGAQGLTSADSDQPFVAPGLVQLFDENVLTVRITPDRSLADFFVRSHVAARSCVTTAPVLLLSTGPIS